MKKYSCLIVLMVLVGCEVRQGRSDASMAQGEDITLRHARHLRMERFDDGCVLAELRNPWDTTRILHRYYLVPRIKEDANLIPHPSSLIPEDATLIRVPLQRAAVYTAIHAGLLQELGCLGQIGGVCDAEYIASAEIHRRVADGRITDYGYGLDPNLELIMDTQPDALMPSPFENAGYGSVEKLGIPIVECADYMETSPLGQAEWMRFYGILFGVEAKADSLFAEVEKKYLRIKDEGLGIKERPTVFCDMLTSGTWYVPGGRSTMARMIADAGGDYVFADTDRGGSVALNFEAVLDKAELADIWLVKYNAPMDYTLSSLAAENKGYKQFAAYRAGRVYGCNTSHVPFFEESRFHPDRVLQNLSDVFKGGGGRYYERIKD